jgi:hypothetical protein
MNKNLSLKFMTAFAVIFALGSFLTSCGPDDTPTAPTTETTDTTGGDSKEYLIIDGTRYEPGDYTKRVYDQGGDRKLELTFGEGVYPQLEIAHEPDDNDELDTRIYIPAKTSIYFPDGDAYEVGFWYAEGPLPTFCQNFALNSPSTPHGKYELKTVDGKLVSEFGTVQMDCAEGNSKAISTIEGYLVWE